MRQVEGLRLQRGSGLSVSRGLLQLFELSHLQAAQAAVHRRHVVGRPPGFGAWCWAAWAVAWQGGEWVNAVTAPPAPVMLGINATADATNRLTVSAPATLLTHEGAGHQLKINKALPADTASLLFQSGWQGRAEPAPADGAWGGAALHAMALATLDGVAAQWPQRRADIDVLRGWFAAQGDALAPLWANVLGADVRAKFPAVDAWLSATAPLAPLAAVPPPTARAAWSAARRLAPAPATAHQVRFGDPCQLLWQDGSLKWLASEEGRIGTPVLRTRCLVCPICRSLDLSCKCCKCVALLSRSTPFPQSCNSACRGVRRGRRVEIRRQDLERHCQ